MVLEFKKYEGGATLTSLGTVRSIVGAKGSYSIDPKNFKNAEKRVVLICKKADGTSTTISCSDQVSRGLRNGTIHKDACADFEVLYGESEIPFVSLPSGNLVETLVDDVKVTAFTPTAVKWEDLIAL